MASDNLESLRISETLHASKKKKKKMRNSYLFHCHIGRDDLNRFPLVHDLLIGGILQSDFRWAPPMGGFANNSGVHTMYVYIYIS